MPEGDISLSSTYNAWNVASGYSYTKILKILVLCDDYIRIAEFGCINIDDMFMRTPDMIAGERVVAIKRLCSELIMLIENTYFAVRKEHKAKLDIFRTRLRKIRAFLPKIETRRFDARVNKYMTNINEEHFMNCLEDMRDIKEAMMTPLNSSGFIFPESEEVDIDKIKQEIMESG